MAERIKQRDLRLDDAQDLILEGLSRVKIAKYLVEKYDISGQTAYNDYNTASLIIKRKSADRKPREKAFLEIDAKYSAVYQLAKEQGDAEMMIKAAKHQMELHGLEPDGPNIRVDHHHKDATIIIGSVAPPATPPEKEND